MTVRVLTLGVFAASVSACSYFGGGEDKPKAEAMTVASVGKLSSDCARLQPLFGPDDKELTKDMLNAALKKELGKWDKDSSGDLSYMETQPLNEELRSENVGASPVRDWNADGLVDEKEFGAGWRTMFDLCDRNHNNAVSVRELGFSPNVAAPRTAPAPEKKKPEGSSAPKQGGY
jgi:hypothetical protein